MTIRVKHDPLLSKILVINTDDVLELGWEKALIILNFEKAFSSYKEDYHKLFPIEKKRVHKLVNELKKSGHLVEEEVINE